MKKLGKNIGGIKMKVVISEENIKDFISKLENVKALTTESPIEFNKDNVEICTMDASSIGMISLEILKEYFLEYEVKETEKIKVMLADVILALKSFKKVDVVMETKENQLFIKGSNGKKGYTLALLDVYEKEQKMPEMEMDVKFQIQTEEFLEALKDISGFSDVIGLDFNKGLSFTKSSGQTGSLTDFFSKVVIDEGITVLKDGEAKGKYAISYLMSCVKNLSGTLEVSFGTDYPIKIIQQEGCSKTIFVLAPRVDCD